MIDQNILYSECPCGSGKKFKFCCYPEIRRELSQNPSQADVTQAIRRRSQESLMSERTGNAAIIDLDAFFARIREGLRHLHARRYAEAKSAFLKAKETCDILPTAYNNLAICALVQGKLKEADEWVQEVVQKFPLDNPFGLSMLADLRYLRGDVFGANEAIGRAEKVNPPSVDQAARVCESMAHFMDHERIVRYVEGSGFADDPEVAFFHGVALANLGKSVEAARALRIALRGHQPDYVKRILEGVTAGTRPPTISGDWMYFTHNSFTLFAGLHQSVRKSGEQQWDLSGEVMAEFIEVETNCGLLDLTTAVKILSGLFASKRLERMLDALRNDATRTEDIRKAAEDAYQKIFAQNDAGRHLREAPIGGIQQMIISEDAATHAPLDPACENDYQEAVGICLDPKRTDADVRKALRLLKKLHVKIPENPAVTNNYASVLSMNGHLRESINLVAECFAKHPEYVFGASNYLKLLILGNRMAEAKAMHDNYHLPQRIHPDAYMGWCRVEMMLYTKLGDNQRLEKVVRCIDLIKKQFPHRMNLA